MLAAAGLGVSTSAAITTHVARQPAATSAAPAPIIRTTTVTTPAPPPVTVPAPPPVTVTHEKVRVVNHVHVVVRRVVVRSVRQAGTKPRRDSSRGHSKGKGHKGHKGRKH
jgi:hypothetical protein